MRESRWFVKKRAGMSEVYGNLAPVFTVWPLNKCELVKEKYLNDENIFINCLIGYSIIIL